MNVQKSSTIPPREHSKNQAVGFAKESPDLSKPLSRFSAPYWAMMHGITAALKGDAHRHEDRMIATCSTGGCAGEESTFTVRTLSCKSS